MMHGKNSEEPNTLWETLSFVSPAEPSSDRPVFRRDSEVSYILSLLNRLGENRRVMISGRKGTGKTTFIDDILLTLQKADLPDSLKNLTPYRVQAEAAIQAYLSGVTNFPPPPPDSLLIVDDLDSFFLRTEALHNGSAMRLSLLLWLFSGQQGVLATTAPEILSRMQALEPLWLEKMSLFYLREFTSGESRSILLLHRDRFSQLFDLVISDRIIDEIIDLTETLLRDRAMPQSALELLETGCATAAIRVRHEKQGTVHDVSSDDLYRQLSQFLRVPVGSYLGINQRQILDLKQQLGLEIFGQDKAIDQLVRAVQRSLLGTREPGPRRPLGVFLFMGPTGVGKTETSRALARTLFGQDQTIMINMAEFQDPVEGIQRLRSTALAERIRLHPFSVVVFDEIEKSCQRIREFFLNLFDSGTFTDSVEQDVDASNTFFILTSNVGAELFEQSRGILPEAFSDQDYSVKKGQLIEALKQENFRPEFINRLDDIILFKPLQRQDIHDIISSNLRAYARLIEESEGKRVIIDEGLFPIFAKGCDLNFGARDARRILRKSVYSQILRTETYYEAERLIITRGPNLKALDFITVLLCSRNKQDGISLVLKLNQDRLHLRARRIDDVKEISTSLLAAQFDLVLLHTSIDEEGRRVGLQAALDQLKKVPHRAGVYLVVDSFQPVQPFKQYLEQGIRGLLRVTELEEWLAAMSAEIKQRKMMQQNIEFSFDELVWKQTFDTDTKSLVLTLEDLGRPDRVRFTAAT